MARLGLCEDEVRLPLEPVSENTGALIDAALRHAGLLS
jgi:4-hydroxy-tetrahydrodipicolinate synthase